MSDKLSFSPDDKLDEALAMLAAGTSVDDVLADAGNDAEWLRPLLETAVEVSGLRQAIPVPAPDASLQRMLAHAAAIKIGSSSTGKPQPGWFGLLANFFGGSYRLVATLAATILLVALVGGTLTVVAQRSLPGQVLYGLKRTSETLRLNLTRDESQLQRLVETFNQRRQEEIRLLLARGQRAEVSFIGRVEAITASSVTINGLVAQIRPETAMSGQLGVKARVRFEGRTDPPDRLIAFSLIVIEPAPPIPTSTATATSTSTPTPTNTSTATASPTASSSATPRPTAALAPTPAATNTPFIAAPVAPVRPPTGDKPGLDDQTTNDNAGKVNDNSSKPDPGDDNTNDNRGPANDGNDNREDQNDQSGGDNDNKGGDKGQDNNDQDKDTEKKETEHDDNDNDRDDNSGRGSSNSDSGSSNSGSNSSGGDSDSSGSGNGKDDDDK